MGEHEIIPEPFPEGSLEARIMKGIGARLTQSAVEGAKDVYVHTGVAVSIRYRYSFDPEQVKRLADYLRSSEHVSDIFYLWERELDGDNGQ